MNPLLLKTAMALALAAASLSASAVGRIADVQVFDRNTGQSLPVHYHRGEYWVAGQPGAKYAIQIRNSRGPRLLAVTSVDGLNVLSGATADFSQSGYVFESGQRYGIEGWRKSDQEVAAFVFTAKPGDSYAERIGKPRDMGVIGVALFREKPPVALYSPPMVAAPSAAAVPRYERATERPAELSEKFRENSSSPLAAPSASAAAAPTPTPSPVAPQADASSRKAAPSMERERIAALPEASGAPQAAPMPAAKLGTAHGERESSIVSRTQFTRNSPQPDEIIRIRYDSHANLVALGIIPSPRTSPVPNPFPGARAGFVPDLPAWR